MTFVSKNGYQSVGFYCREGVVGAFNSGQHLVCTARHFRMSNLAGRRKASIKTTNFSPGEPKTANMS